MNSFQHDTFFFVLSIYLISEKPSDGYSVHLVPADERLGQKYIQNIVWSDKSKQYFIACVYLDISPQDLFSLTIFGVNPIVELDERFSESSCSLICSSIIMDEEAN